jgi:hypothetical protein
VAEKARSTGAVYRDEAAELMAAAARGTTRPAPPEIELTARRAAPEIRVETPRPESQRPEPRRPLPYPDPVGINDNDDATEGDYPQAPRTQRRRLNFGQLLARIVIAPLYIAVAVGAVAVISLFARGFLAG